MKKILISIHPKYVERIMAGTKRFEFRTKAAKQDIDSLIIYATYPVMKVVAEVKVIEVLAMHPSELWEVTSKYSGIDKKDFDKYFRNRLVAYAYKLGEVHKFIEHQKLDYYGIQAAPQSFVYVNQV